jgi:anti-sigma B factor antagonist
MLLRVETEDRDGAAVVTAAGEIDAATADSLKQAISSSLDAGVRRVLVDFAEVTFIDSTGLGVLVKAHRNAEAADASFGVVHPTRQTRKLIGVLGLDELLNIYDSFDEAFAEQA